MPSPRILYVTSCWPHDRPFGGQLRTLHIGRALQKLGEVTLTVVSEDAADGEILRKAAADFNVEPPIRVNLVPNHSLSQRCRWALDPHFLNIHGYVADDADRARLLNRVPDFDLVWLSNSRTPNILNRWHWPHSVLDVDNVPSAFQRAFWQNGAGLKEKLGAGIRMRLLKRRERSWKERFSVLSVCSEPDRQYLGNGEQVHVIPNGFERPTEVPVRHPVDPPRIGFIGIYNYLPNPEGMKWFVHEVWPRVKQQIPRARLRIVGRETDGPLRPQAPDADALGFVADPAEEIATWSAMIVPIRLGAGTRVKIAEAFSRKCPVVSTRLGAYGYEVQNGQELLLADDPAAFADACVSLARDPQAANAMAERAFAAFLRNWTWDAITPRIHATAEDCLRRSHSLAGKSDTEILKR